MTASAPVRSRYERRVDLVSGVLMKEADLGQEAADKIAVAILAAIDHVPEIVR